MKSVKSLIKLLLATTFITNLALSNAIAKIKAPEEPKHKDVDIFSEIEMMEKQMANMIIEHQKHMQKMFENYKKNFSTSENKTSVAMLQDEKSYSYELHYSGFKKEDIIINVENGVLTFLANNEETSQKNEKNALSSKNFYYSIGLPSNIDNKPEISREDRKVTVKFNKKTN